MNTPRIAVAGYFAILGFVSASWVSSIDDLKILLGVDDSTLGWLLLAGPCGNLISFLFASSLFSKIGSRRGLIVSVSLYLLSAVGMAVCFLSRAPILVWCLAIAALGGLGNLFNIAVNTQGGIVERRMGTNIMNAFHGMFSVSCLAGGLFALGASSFAISPGIRIGISFLVALVLHALLMFRLPEDDHATEATQEHKRWHRPDRALLVLGFAALVIMGCEGAIGDWVGVFYRDSLQAPETRVKWGYCSVVGAMTIGRFVTDRLLTRFGARRILHVYCVLVAFGLMLGLGAPYMVQTGLSLHLFATLGFAITGFGISALVPILYSRGNRTKCMPAASAITFLGSMGFLGYFMGPPLIGHLAVATSLSVAMGVFAVLILFCLFIDPERDTAG